MGHALEFRVTTPYRHLFKQPINSVLHEFPTPSLKNFIASSTVSKIIQSCRFSNLNLSHRVTDTNFLIKMQKRVSPPELELPLSITNHRKMIVTINLKFLGLCQPIDITQTLQLCYIIFYIGESVRS